jgi:hypothetical protein
MKQTNKQTNLFFKTILDNNYQQKLHHGTIFSRTDMLLKQKGSCLLSAIKLRLRNTFFYVAQYVSFLESLVRDTAEKRQETAAVWPLQRVDHLRCSGKCCPCFQAQAFANAIHRKQYESKKYEERRNDFMIALASLSLFFERQCY